MFPDSVSENYYKAVCASTGQTSSPQSKSVESETTAEVVVVNANIRESSTANSRILQKVEKGVRFFLADVEPTNGWYQVFIPDTNETGWLYGSTIKIFAVKSNFNQPKQKSKPTPGKRGRRAD